MGRSLSIRKSIIATALVALAFAGLPVMPNAQDRVDISLENGRFLARDALLAGNAELARDIAVALLDANPDDRLALLILAGALTRLGDATEGRRAGARAYRVARSPIQRYEAARLTALAAANENRFLLSRYWLQRAAHAAPDDGSRRQTQADLAGLRNLSPLSFSVSGGIGPSQNLNGGSMSALNVIDGLPFVGVLSPDARSLSGWAATGRATLGYRIRGSDKRRTDLIVDLSLRRVRLSDDSLGMIRDYKVANPTFTFKDENADFGQSSLSFTLRHSAFMPNGLASLAVNYGLGWDGVERSADTLGLEFSRAWSLERQAGLEFGLSIVASLGDTDTVLRRAKVRYQFPHAEVATIAATAEWTQTLSSNGNEQREGKSLTVEIAPDLGDAPIELSLSAGLSDTRYPDYAVVFPVPGGRQDTHVYGAIEMSFPRFDLAGFTPALRIDHARSTSNVSRFETETTSFGLALRSSF